MPMLVVKLGPGGELNLILRLESLLAIPPGAATVKVTSNVRGADDRHNFSPPSFVRKISIAQIF